MKYEFTEFLLIMCWCLFVLQLMCFLSIVVSGTAGVIVSLSRIFTKLLVEDEKNNTIIFFLFSISIETLCFLLHVVVRQTHFVRYHTDRARRSHSWLKGQINNVPTQKRSGYQIHYDSGAEEEVNSHTETLVCIWLLGTFCETVILHSLVTERFLWVCLFSFLHLKKSYLAQKYII